MRTTLSASVTALRGWSAQRWTVALLATLLVGGLIGISTVLIPNPWFARDIPTLAWNYPVWIVASVLTGLLFATYLRADAAPAGRRAARGPVQAPDTGDGVPGEQVADRPFRLGSVGTMLTWFAVGCPVCNKLALLAFGYGGAITWFAPAQPYLAGAAIVFTAVALARRLEGEISCIVPQRTEAAHE